MKILIDNGHGIDTPGKRSPVWNITAQLYEWEFNRAITDRIASALKYHGIDHVLIVPEDLDISLSERVKRINDIARKEECLLVSVHANAGGGTGWEIFTSPGETMSDKYATEFFNTASHMLPNWRMRKDTRDGDPDKEANFALLRKTICPAVLTENMFMDNEKDCKFILSESGRDIIADVHVQSILSIVTLAA